MTYEEADKYYQDNFPPEMSFTEISDKNFWCQAPLNFYKIEKVVR